VAGLVAAVILVGAAAVIWQARLANEAEAARVAYQLDADAKLKEQEEERVAERRQEKLDRAIEAAFGADPKKAHKTIVAAEKAGVAPDRVHWLRGLVHF
jgi:hypothetical protein